MKRILIAISFFILPFGSIYAQELAFNIQAPPPGITITNLGTPGDLNFGTLLQNQGLVQILLNDPEAVVLSIEGKENKRIRVTLTSPLNLRVDATNTMPFTLGAAYNDSGNNNAAGATTISGTTVTFKLPKDKGPEKTGTAYLYIFGDINVGNVRAGLYSGTINVFVEYD